LLRQKRRSVTAHINLNPTVTVVYRHPQHDNGFGKLVADYSETPTDRVVKVRIAHPNSQRGPFVPETTSTGVRPATGRYVLAEYDADLLEGDRIEDFRVGPIDPLIAYGAAVGKQAPLTDVDTVESS
jgi:hypothetical protein